MAWSQKFRKSDISLHTASWRKCKKNTKARCWPIKAKKSSLPTKQMFRQHLFWTKTILKQLTWPFVNWPLLEIKRNNKRPNSNRSSIGRKVEIIKKNSKQQRKSDILKINVSHERYLSTDLHFLIAIVVWGESLNNFENLKKLWCTPEFFHKKVAWKIIF